ncbi:MAG: Gfo/Idh/MocA family protein [Kiritimatiellia bacterium]
MNRRDFLGLAAGAAAFGIGGVAFGQSRPRQIAAGRKIRLALIGCGARLTSVLVTKCLGEEIVALVDPDTRRFAAMRQRVASLDPAYDMSKVREFRDWRECLDKMAGEIDAAIIASNQQSHAPIAIACMRRGIHVYVEKPICYSEEEADLLAACAKKYGVVTQAGHHGHSNPLQPLVAEYVQSGALGQIRDVWCYSDRLNAQRALRPVGPAPAGVDWDLWCGPADYRPYSDSYRAEGWFDWRGFGNGSLGNMGNHVIDTPFWALDLVGVNPSAVTMDDMSYPCAASWPTREMLTYEYPARAGMDPVKLHWIDGVRDDVEIDQNVQYHFCKRELLNFPPIVLELEAKHKMSLGNIGTLFFGEKGILWVGPFGNSLQFVPLALKKQIPTPPRKYRRLAKGKSHVHEFFDAIREGRKANADFVEYAVPLVKTVLMGNVSALAARDGNRRLEWDGTRVTNCASANAYCRTTYRKGWEIEQF